MQSSLLVRAAFGLLVLSTLAAFLVTQRLKRAPPVVQRVYYARYVSPNGDGRKDIVGMRFDLPAPDRVSVSVVDDDGREVRRLADDRALAATRHRFRWDGLTEGGARAPDGDYHLRVSLRSEGRSLTAPRTVTLDTVAPTPRILAVTPSAILPGSPDPLGRARIRYEGPSDPAPVFRVFRVDRERAREIARFRGPRFRRTAAAGGPPRPPVAMRCR